MKKLLVFPLLCIAISLVGMVKPIPLNQKIDESYGIALVKLNHQQAYWDENFHNIHTLYVFDVIAYLKGELRTQQLAIITEGGIIDNEMQISFPDFHIDDHQEYLMFFTDENFDQDHLTYRITHFDLPQCKVYSSVQGLFPNQNGSYHDWESEFNYTEKEIFKKIKTRTNFTPITPDLEPWRARETPSNPIFPHRMVTSINNGAMTNPSFYIAGTVETDNELIISGSGFGGTAGTVFFPNANEGGASLTASGTASDLISWSDTEIRVKIPELAGTGNLAVYDNGNNFIGSIAITIEYSITGVYSDFSGFPEIIRQFANLADLNGSGGYTFLYNSDLPNTSTDFAGNTPAQEALERAFDTWRCESGVNFFTDGTSTTNDYTNDDVNVIGFTNDLAAGVLGAATLRFLAYAGGGCTYWFLEELDIRFDDDTNWNFGPDSPTGLEMDFESVALHEIGHTHGLNHTIDVSQTMHYSINAGDEKRTLSSGEMSASTYMMGLSTQAPCIAGGPVPTQMVAVSTMLDGSSCSLPITLLDFKGELKNRASHLNWVTSFEKNNQYFEIEHSNNGIEYKTIGRVLSQGDAEFNQYYQFIHERPSYGNNYYRLSQNDFDGMLTVYGVIQIKNEGGPKQLLVNKNPINDGLFEGQVNLNNPQQLSFNFYAPNGQVLKSHTANFEKGWNNVQFSVAELNVGLYYLEIKGKDFSKSFSLLVEQ